MKKLFEFVQLHLIILFLPNVNYMLPLQLRAEYCSMIQTLKTEKTADTV
jgi:hypothetical protein